MGSVRVGVLPTRHDVCVLMERWARQVVGQSIGHTASVLGVYVDIVVETYRIDLAEQAGELM